MHHCLHSGVHKDCQACRWHAVNELSTLNWPAAAIQQDMYSGSSPPHASHEREAAYSGSRCGLWAWTSSRKLSQGLDTVLSLVAVLCCACLIQPSHALPPSAGSSTCPKGRAPQGQQSTRAQHGHVTAEKFESHRYHRIGQGCGSHVVPAAINEWLIAGVVRGAIALNRHLWTFKLAVSTSRL